MRWPEPPPERRRIPDDPAGLAWARGVLRAALNQRPSSEPPPLSQASLGDFELLEELGRGATSIVYRARQRSLSREVALKIMKERELSDPAEVQRFCFGAQAAAELDHPHIAPIYQVGAVNDVPFVAMQLFNGGTLAASGKRLRQLPVSTVTLLAKIARAVHYAHERGVLHRDLKPANVVLDENDEPYVVDFGFAKHLDERALTSKPSILVGTIGYMAPEQAAGVARSLTFASDIWALGAMLYELLTGEVPYEKLALAEKIERLTSAEPVRSPRELDPNIDRELAWICLKCLEKEPRKRYATAQALAQDLERWLRREPIAIGSDGTFARFMRWCRAHPALVTALSGAIFVLGTTAAVGISVARDLEQAQRSDMLGINSFAAQAKAGQALSLLRELSSPVARCASDPRVVDLLGHNAEPHTYADRLLVECGAKSLFDSVAVLGSDGHEHARFPRRTRPVDPSEVMQHDYFEGARWLGHAELRSVHIGRVLRSEDDHGWRVSLSAPVFGTDNQWLGIVATTIDMPAFLDSLSLPDNGRQMAVLAGVAEAEPSDSDEARAQGVMILLHGQLGDAEAADADRWRRELTRLKQRATGREQFREFTRSLDDNPQAFPVTIFGHRWLAGFAPVGHTGYAIVVQSRYEITSEQHSRWLAKLLGTSGGIFVLGTAAVLALTWLLGKRRRTART